VKYINLMDLELLIIILEFEHFKEDNKLMMENRITQGLVIFECTKLIRM
jgi:hypothetical protein